MKVTAIAWVSNRIKCFGDQRFCSVMVVPIFAACGKCGVCVQDAYFAMCLAYSKAALVSAPLSHPNLHLA